MTASPKSRLLGPIEVLDAIALHCQSATSDKVWACVLARLSDGGYGLLRCWGRRNGTYAFKAEMFFTSDTAQERLWRTVDSKEGKGYYRLPDWEACGIRGYLESQCPGLGAQTSMPQAATPPTVVAVAGPQPRPPEPHSRGHLLRRWDI
jgi:hypothetical protein